MFVNTFIKCFFFSLSVHFSITFNAENNDAQMKICRIFFLPFFFFMFARKTFLHSLGKKNSNWNSIEEVQKFVRNRMEYTKKKQQKWWWWECDVSSTAHCFNWESIVSLSFWSFLFHFQLQLQLQWFFFYFGEKRMVFLFCCCKRRIRETHGICLPCTVIASSVMKTHWACFTDDFGKYTKI